MAHKFEPTCYMEDPEGVLRRWSPAEEMAKLHRVARHAQTVMQYLEESGAAVVPHLMDSDDNPGERLRDALADVGMPIRTQS